MNGSPVLAADRWPTNGHLIADVAQLGYLRTEDEVLDPTYGRGVWWKRWRPERLTTHDLRLDRVDFRYLPYSAGSFDAVAYDPPYVCVGGRKTTTLPDLHDRFGLTCAPKSPAELQTLINHGLSECARVSRRTVLVKCQDYISSGTLWPGTHYTLAHGLNIVGLTLVDRFEHIGNARPQPSTNRDGTPRRQVHARRNLSTLFVFELPRA